MFLAVSIVVLLIIFGLWKLTHAFCLKIEDRAYQIRSVFVSVIFAVLCVIFYVEILSLINLFFGISGVRSFLFYIMPQLFASAGFYWIVTLALSLFVTLTFVIVMFCVYHFWLKPVSKRKREPKNPLSRFFDSISKRFFFMDEKPYMLRYSAENIRRWIGFMRNAFGILLVLISVAVSLLIHFGFSFISETDLSVVVKSLYMLSLLSFFILDQVYMMLNALEPDSTKGVDTESIGLEHMGDYSGFISLFEGLFGGNALISYYINNQESEYVSISTGPDSEQLERAKRPELLSAVCRSVNNSFSMLSKNYIDALIDLTNGENIVVFDSYYGEFALYYLSYLQVNLFNRRKALIIVDTEEQVEQVIGQYRQIFTRINKVNPIWRITDLKNMPTHYDDADILVCTEEQLFMQNAKAKHAAFFERVHDVMVTDVYGILCRDKAFMLRFVNELRSQVHDVQFLFYVDENNPDIRKSLKELFGCSEIKLYTNFNDAKGSCVMMWRGESYYKTQNAIVDNLYYDFGVGYTLALFGGQYGVPEINLYADEHTPLITYESIVNDLGKDILSNVFHTTESVRVDSFVKINPVSAFYRRDLAFDIFYDNCNNIVNTVRLALSDSAVLSSLVHIISRPYMLRDYFAYNINRLCYNTAVVQKLVPTIISDLRAPSIALLIKLREHGMTCEQIIAYMNSFGMISNNVEEILAEALGRALGEETDAATVYSAFSFGKDKIAVFENSDYRYTRKVRLTNEDFYLRVKALSEDNAHVVGEISEVLPISRNDVYNYFLPGQTWSFASRRYLINSIRDGDINVSLEETTERELSYTNCYSLSVSNADSEPYASRTDEAVRCELYRADVTRVITGYLSHTNGLDFGYMEQNTHSYPLSEPITEKKHASVLSIGIRRPFKDRYAQSAALFAVLFRGLLESVLPYNYRDILVATRVKESDFTKTDFYDDSTEGMRRDPLPSDWIEADNYELPISRTLLNLFPRIEGELIEDNNENEVRLYLIEFSENDSSALESVMNDIERLLSILRSYMEWYLTNPELPHGYLKLGYKRIPNIFDTSTVHGALQSIAVEISTGHRMLGGRLSIADPGNAEHCSFCGRLIEMTKWRFSDNRCMCEDCYKHRTNERKEIEELLKEAYSTLESAYNVTIPKGIKIKFKSAESIRKASQSPPSGRILGMYVPKKKQLWVERGGPRACVLSTLLHELTHAWQFADLNTNAIELMYLEGHSVYVEIECMTRLGQERFAEFNERCIMAQDDEYSKGLKYWRSHLLTETDKNIFNHMMKKFS